MDPNDDFVPNICHHLAIIFHVESSPPTPLIVTGQLMSAITIGGSISKSRSSSHATLKELDPLILFDVLVDVLVDENIAHAKAIMIELNIFTEHFFLVLNILE